MRATNTILLVLFCFTSISCSDDNITAPNGGESFEFPLAIGNEWTYGLYKLDVNHEPAGDPIIQKFVKIIDKIEYKGKTSYEVDKSSSLIYKYYSKDDNAIYGHVDYENLSSDGKNYYPDYWMKIYDFHNDNWTVYSKDVKVEDGDYKAEGTIAMFGEKIGKTTTILNKIVVDLYEFRAILSIESTETNNGSVESYSEKDTTYITFADGIGIYSIAERKVEKDEEFMFYGTEERLIKYILFE